MGARAAHADIITTTSTSGSGVTTTTTSYACGPSFSTDVCTFSFTGTGSGTPISDFEFHVVTVQEPAGSGIADPRPEVSDVGLLTNDDTLATQLVDDYESDTHISDIFLDAFYSDGTLEMTDEFQIALVQSYFESTDGYYTFNVDFERYEVDEIVSSTPEPSTVMLLASGLLALGARKGWKLITGGA